MYHAWFYNKYVLSHHIFYLGVQTEKWRVIYVHSCFCTHSVVLN